MSRRWQHLLPANSRSSWRSKRWWTRVAWDRMHIFLPGYSFKNVYQMLSFVHLKTPSLSLLHEVEENPSALSFPTRLLAVLPELNLWWLPWSSRSPFPSTLCLAIQSCLASYFAFWVSLSLHPLLPGSRPSCIIFHLRNFLKLGRVLFKTSVRILPSYLEDPQPLPKRNVH